MQWNTKPEVMKQITESIDKVLLDLPLKQVLSEDFPNDSSSLPIIGGWGYKEDDAIKFIVDPKNQRASKNFVMLEYDIAQKIIYEELIICRPEDYRFSGINLKLQKQETIHKNNLIFDKLLFDISCWSDWHWFKLKEEWEENEFGQKQGFDLQMHQEKRDAAMIIYQREFWFDITDVFNA